MYDNFLIKNRNDDKLLLACFKQVVCNTNLSLLTQSFVFTQNIWIEKGVHIMDSIAQNI